MGFLRPLLKHLTQLVNFIICDCESSAPFFVIYKAGREPTPLFSHFHVQFFFFFQFRNRIHKWMFKVPRKVVDINLLQTNCNQNFLLKMCNTPYWW
jgi:hypothetical protein